jgi:predicted DNA-binding protein
MNKTEVYSWRLSPDMKHALEEAARRNHKTVAKLLNHIVEQWLREIHAADQDAEETEQRRLHAAAATALGSIQGGDPDRSERARAELRARLARKHGR